MLPKKWQALGSELKNIKLFLVSCRIDTKELTFTHESYYYVYEGDGFRDIFSTEEKGIPVFTAKKIVQLITADCVIIGYKAPMDFFGGKVKKGDVARKAGMPENSYTFDTTTLSNCFPKELVETWEPVYEETTVEIGGYKAEAIDGAIHFGCQSFDKNTILVLADLLSRSELKMKIGVKGEYITSETILKLIKML